MVTFSGSITTTGKSEAIRLDKALFRPHPEFRRKANVRFQLISPGHTLISVVDETSVLSVRRTPWWRPSSVSLLRTYRRVRAGSLVYRRLRFAGPSL
jgi:hypothetical protein